MWTYLSVASRARFIVLLGLLISGVFGEVVNAEHQLHWVTENVLLLRQCGAFEPVYTVLRSSCLWMENDEFSSRKNSSNFTVKTILNLNFNLSWK